jgi:hypothetical protein
MAPTPRCQGSLAGHGSTLGQVTGVQFASTIFKITLETTTARIQRRADRHLINISLSKIP